MLMRNQFIHARNKAAPISTKNRDSSKNKTIRISMTRYFDEKVEAGD